MSHIDDLIAELCPDGVEFYCVEELFDLRNGYTPSKSKPQYWENGTVPWFRMEDIRENGRILSDSILKVSAEAVKGGKLFPANSILMATSATIGEHALIEVPHLSNQRFTSLSIKVAFRNKIIPKFAFYYCFVLGEWCRKNTKESSFAAVDMYKFKNFRFPVPPLEAQRAIVDVLDTFTKLEAELEAELEARRKQYNYWSGRLLTQYPESELLALSRIVDLKAGKAIETKRISEHKSTVNLFPCYGANGLRGFTSTYSSEGAFPLIGRQGALCGNVNWADGQFYVTEHALLATPKPGIDSRWAYHALRAADLNQYATKSAQPGLSVGRLNQVSLLVPNLGVQRAIAERLDMFDALVNDLSFGLPAEIAARRKQYEHYRDRLLTFRELER